MDAISNLRARCSKCVACTLAHRRQNVVVDRGDPTSPLVFIGEAPGASEDRQGKPFVGASGKLMRRLCAAAGFEFDETYITNVLKCRPAFNKFPRDDVVETCLPWVQQQLEILKPPLVVLAGAKALDWIIQRELGMADPVGRYAGKVVLLPEVYPYVKRFYVIYHPAYLLRKNSRVIEDKMVRLLTLAAEDLRRVRAGEVLPFLADAFEFRKKSTPVQHEQFDLFLPGGG